MGLIQGDKPSPSRAPATIRRNRSDNLCWYRLMKIFRLSSPLRKRLHLRDVQQDAATHNWHHLKTSVKSFIEYLLWSTKTAIKDKQIELVSALGHVKDAHTVVAVSPQFGERQFTAKHIVIAVASQPIMPDLPGAKEHAITTDQLFSLDRTPGKTLVVGRWVDRPFVEKLIKLSSSNWNILAIAVECACFLQGFGFDTAILFPEKLLDNFDHQMAEHVADAMVEKKIRLIRGKEPACIVRNFAKKDTCHENNFPGMTLW